jgi:hypothetical protein
MRIRQAMLDRDCREFIVSIPETYARHDRIPALALRLLDILETGPEGVKRSPFKRIPR